MHDEHYKRLFAFPRLVEDLLRGFVGGDWLETVDFSTLDKLSAEYVGDELRVRRGDTVWRVRRRDGWLHVLVLLEFQSRDDPDMALRILEYTTLLYRELARNRGLEPDGRRPPVLPVVLYNGAAPWRAARDVSDLIAPVSPSLAPYQPAQRYVVLDERRVRSDDGPEGNLMAAVVALEQSRSPEDLERVLAALQRRAWAPDEERLAGVFAEWVWRLMRHLARGDPPPAPVYTLEGVRMTLEERVSEWPRQWRQEGLEQGIKQGIERGIEQGIERGIEQGIERGIEQQRALLRRLAGSRFGAGAAERLTPVLERIADPERLAEVGDLIVRCETGDELLARADAAQAEPPQGRL